MNDEADDVFGGADRLRAEAGGGWHVGRRRIGAGGLAKPHAHVMLTMRAMNEQGFGAKERDWNRTELVEQWRER